MAPATDASDPTLLPPELALGADDVIEAFADGILALDDSMPNGTYIDMCTNLPVIDPILSQVYGADAGLWRRRWRLFFLATSGLFGHAGGESWGVGHYRLKPA